MADFEQLKAWAQADWEAQAEYRQAMQDEFAFRDGYQWSDEEKAALEENARVAIVFNRVGAVINAVAGSEINNRTEVRFIPREIGDIKPNEVLTAGAEWFRDEANAEDEESQAFADMLCVGLGWTETLLDFDSDAEGAPAIMRIDPTEMFWDSHAHRKGLSDARRVGRVRNIPIEEARGMFPGASDYDLHAQWIDKTAGDPTIVNNIIGDEYKDGENTAGRNADGTVTVVQIQWRDRIRVVEYIDPGDGQRKEMSPADWKKLSALMPIDAIPHREFSRLEWRQAFLGADILLENQPCKMAPTFQAMTGNWDRKKKRFYGMLRTMMDPQRYANKWLSQTLHIINSNAKGGVMVEEDAVSDMRQFEDSWSAADGVTWVRPGRSPGVVPKPSAQIPSSIMQLTEFAISSIRDVSGVSLELMGMRETAQAGVLEYQRRQSSMTTLATYFDSLRYYRKRQGQVILGFLVDWIAPTGRLVRIVRDGLAQYVPLAMNAATQKFDVIVDDSPQAPNEKERAWQVIQQLIPIMQNAGLGLEDWADIMDYSPLPSSFAEKLRAKAQEQSQNAEADPAMQMQMQAAQLQAKKTQSEIEENQAQALLDQARAFEIQMKAQREAIMPPGLMGM